MHLYAWQIEALEKWEENGFKGIANVVTGAGKTMLALAAIQRLSGVLSKHDLKVKIIVPKTFLVRQWLYALRETLGVSRDDIGLFFGSHKDKVDRKYMIYVINSARYTFARHILDDCNLENHIFLIADECHHYGTLENSKIFDFIKMIPDFSQYYALGLSATPFSKNYESILEPYLGQEIYRFTFAEALNANIINRFSILNIGLDFTRDERAEYEEYSDKLNIALHQIRKHCPHLYIRNSQGFFSTIENIIKTHKNPNVRQLAQAIMFLSYQRKEVVHLASARTKCVMDLVGLIDKNSKIIIFGERIEMADAIYKRIKTIYPNEAGIYHSKLHKDIKKITLRNFEDSQIRILVSCKTLDEGLNISEADVGIIASSTSSERQRIQRLGRILRKKESGRQSYFYYLYVKDTMEETEVFDELNNSAIKNINIIDLYYDEKIGAFTNPYYEELAHMAVVEAENKHWDYDKIQELRRNIELGVIVCDWWTTEDECMGKIKASASKRERNYYVAMLFLIRIRLSKINDSF